jgi:hypothetical protein
MGVTLVVNQRLNSILAHAPPDKMAVIAQAIEVLDVPSNRQESMLTNLNRFHRYPLSGVEPELIVKTLHEVGNLDPSTRLEIDRKNKTIVAYATLADHMAIRTVVEKLSGSERQFEVKQLRRLASDYVAGTIELMMGKGKKEKTSRLSYYLGYNEPSNSDRGANEFRVDADVEHNRLLLYANEVELAEVDNLLVKLGEIAPRGSRRETLRVIDAHNAKDARDLMEKIRRAWPSMSPNPIIVNPSPAEPPGKKVPAEESLPIEPASKTTHWTEPGRLESLKLVQLDTEESESPSPRSENLAGKPPSPLKVTVEADGRLTVSCDDPEILDIFEDLAAQIGPPVKDYKVFKLKYAWAYGVAMNLEDFFREGEKKQTTIRPWYWDPEPEDDSKNDRRLSKRRPVKFISDTDTNSILVENADAGQLKTIEELIQIYDQPTATDSQSVRKTEILHLEHSKAKMVAETVKEVFRDLLSANDKALAGTKGNERESNRGFLFMSSDEGEKNEQKMPKFKGLISIGVDEVSNSLAVSAPAYLFDQVTKLIKELDDAAAPTSTVKVVKLGHGVNSEQMCEMLNNMLGEESSARTAKSPAPTPSKATTSPAKNTRKKKTEATASKEGEGK